MYDPAAMKFKVDFAKIKDAVRDLARQFLILEGDGSYDNVRKFIERYGKMDDITKQMIEKLADIPVDIAPIFKTSY